MTGTCTGTISSYHRGCRCPDCRHAAAAARRARIRSDARRRAGATEQCPICAAYVFYPAMHEAKAHPMRRPA